MLRSGTTLNPPSDHQREPFYFATSGGADLPETVDWRDKGLVTSVKMQVRKHKNIVMQQSGTGASAGGSSERRDAEPALTAGVLWLLLGLQRRGGPGGTAGQDHGEAGRPEPPEPGGLFGQVRQPRLQRRLHEPSLPVRHRQPGHRLGDVVSLPRTGEPRAKQTRNAFHSICC